MVRRKLTLNTKDSKKSVGQSIRGANISITFEEFFNLYEKYIQAKTLQGLASRTLIDYKKHMNIFKEYTEAVKRIDLIRYLDMDVFYEYLSYMLLQKKYSPFTVNIRLRSLKCYLKWLYNEDYIDTDYSIKLKQVKTPKDTIQPLNEVNIRKIFNVLNTDIYSGFRDFTMMVLMLDCGIRVGEAVSLKAKDIDVKGGLINIHAENAKTRVFRTVPISPKTAKLLKELINISSESDCEYIFQSSFGGKIDKMVIIKNFTRYGKRAGLNCRTSPHVFRHTFATNFIKAGGDVFTLQRIMGHAELSTTRKYIQLDNTDLIRKHKQVSMIDKLI